MFPAEPRPPPLKTLHLLRHAKAVEGSPDGTDHARPLAKRGVAAVTVLAQHFKDSAFTVDRIFSSTSKRTRETYELLAPALSGASIAYRDRLYLVDAADLMDFIHGLPDNATSVMLIGHNPAFHSVALMLAKGAARGHSEELTALREKFPTCAVCSLDFDIPHWRLVKAGGGTLTGFLRPRDLDSD